MKHAKTLLLLVFISALTTISCKDESKARSLPKQDTTPQPFQPAPTESAQSTAGVFHYTCSNGCPGGAAAAGNCGTCGNALAHNQAFHANTNTNNNSTPTDTSPFNTETADAGQNAAGVWHYTCSQGCSGGAGSAGNCSTCGNTLAHNQAYHQ